MNNIQDTSRQRLAGRRIVVTGAASGMGAAIARLFTDEGARLALLDLNEERVGQIAGETNQAGIAVDVSSEASVVEAISQAAASLGGIDGVVNAAGILVRTAFEDTDYETFQRIMNVNLAGPFLVSRAALPHLRQAPAATIVNIASMAALRPIAGMGAYSASKAGLVAMSHALGYELGPNIRVNSLCPGLIRTPMVEYLYEEGSPGADAVHANQALGRAGEPSEVAEAALFLTTAESSFISTAALTINGGQFV